MPFRPPLTAEELSAIRARYVPTSGRAPCSFPDSSVWPDILALLHEIRRMRAMLLRFNQMKPGMKAPSMVLEDVLQDLLEQLANEPCVLERETLTQELLYPNDRKVKPQG